MIYKVLWVEDDDTIVGGIQSDADLYGIELDRYSNWSDARDALTANYDTYSAIILDAYCKIDNSRLIEENFLIQVVIDLTALYEKNSPLPWYILSAGTMDKLDFVVDSITDKRKANKEEWGPMYYDKNAPSDSGDSSMSLFRNIIKAASRLEYNVVTCRHENMFKYMGEGKIISSEARSIMLRMLSALYFPENHPRFLYEANPLRRVLEHLFRAAKQKGLLPDECFGKGNAGMNLYFCRKFLAGEDVVYEQDKSKTGMSKAVKWDNEGENIFDEYTRVLAKNILNFANEGSHTQGLGHDDEMQSDKELFFCHVLGLCHVISAFGQFVETHDDAEANRAKIKYFIIEQSVSSQGDYRKQSNNSRTR